MSSIPIVDFASCSISYPSIEAVKKMGKILVDVLSTTGFVYLKNHGISSDAVDEIDKVMRRFFDAPTELKNQYNDGRNIFGYIGLQEEKIRGTKNPGYKEAFTISGFFLDKLDTRWPDELSPMFSKVIPSFMEQCKQLTFQILKVLAVGLDLEDKHSFQKSHSLIHKEGNFTMLKSLHYPPVPDDIMENTPRLVEHSDVGSITLLFQDKIGGLQVQSTSGKYIEAVPIKDTVLVNIGDILQFWTGGKLKSTKHKLDMPTDPIKRKLARFSIAYFAAPNNDVRIDRRLPCVGDQEQIKDDSEPVTVTKFYEKLMNEGYRTPVKL